VAGKLLSVTAIETSGADETYQWDKITGADGFERVILFQHADAQKQPTGEVVRCVEAALDRLRPQIAVIPGWSDKSSLAAVQWCGRNQVPAVIMSDSTAWDDRRKLWKESVKRQIVVLASSALVAGTPHRDYLGQLGLSAERVFLGYDAVDNRYFGDKVAESRKRKVESRNDKKNAEMLKGNQFQLSTFPVSTFQNAPYFLVSARFIEKKNLPRLIEAYARYREFASKPESRKQKTENAGTLKAETGNANAETLKVESRNEKGENRKQKVENKNVFQLSEFQLSAFTPWPLVLLGDGPLKPDLCRLISDLRLQDSVLLPGFIQYPELPTFYAHAGAFIHASTTEQWGLVVNEAMASGLPVLVSNRCGCAQDLVQEGVNGFTFDPYDVEQLAQLMLRIWSMERGAGSGSQRAAVSDQLNPESAPASGAVSRALAENPVSGFDGGIETDSPGGCAPQFLTPSSLLPASPSLGQMGAASQRIIADWGPDRFAQGLQSAVRKALEVGPVKPSFGQRLILKALLWK